MSDVGRADDVVLVAANHGELIGAAWSRLYPDEEPACGTIDADTPHLTLAVTPEHPGDGVGTALLDNLFRRLTEAGYTRVSLSVDRTHQARRLDERVGFITHPVEKSERVMARGGFRVSCDRRAVPHGPALSSWTPCGSTSSGIRWPSSLR